MPEAVAQIFFDASNPDEASVEELNISKDEDVGRQSSIEEYTKGEVAHIFDAMDEVESKEESETEESPAEEITKASEQDGEQELDQTEEETTDSQSEEKVAYNYGQVLEEVAVVTSSVEDIGKTLKRLERKFDEEILNAATRNDTVKVMAKEINEYKSGIIEKALKDFVCDIVDLRETMLSQAKGLMEKGDADTICLSDFLAYADDIADILTRHDVTIYKSEAGTKSVAVRQRIVRRIETDNPEKEKTVASSNSYGYEYNGKIIYPERISVYIKKK